MPEIGPLNEKQKAFLEIIRKKLIESRRLINDSLELAILEAETLTVEIRAIELSDCLEKAVSVLRPGLERKNQQLILKLPDLPRIRADENRLIKMLFNLLDNAHKYTFEGGEITVTAERNGDFVKVWIMDSGIGIAPKDQGLIFHGFFRGEDTYIRDQVGIGLGLKFAKRVIECFEGEIGVESEPGQGSKFWFTVPVAI